MLRTDEILATIQMLHAESLDVRTVTLALNVDDCAAPSMDSLCRKLREKITGRASRLVETCNKVGRKYGIPIVNKRIAISPVSHLLAGHGQAAAIAVAKTLDEATATCGIDLVGGFSAWFTKALRQRTLVSCDHSRKFSARPSGSAPALTSQPPRPA